MNLPQQVVDYLQTDFAAEQRPFCFLVDGNFRLVDAWGDGGWCGLHDANAGADMLDIAPYLIGALESQPRKTSYITTPTGVVVHLVTIPHDDCHYVVLLDAHEAHGALQEAQQSANELRLLQASQQRLIARQRDLIAELVEAKAELDHHRRDAERSSAGKSRFIAMMSHEFRTPLASIINYADLALEDDASNADLRKSVEAIARSGHHLSMLVDTILDEARLDAGQVQLRERNFDLYELLDDLAAMMAPLAAEKGLSFAVLLDADVPRHIHADDTCLRQILINLLGNAVKFTVEGGIRLTTTYGDKRLVATVSDSGPGISVTDQERVFRAFERGGDGSDNHNGAGLGLTITLQLAELMGGEITLDSLPGQGCTVSVHVPAPLPDSPVSKDEVLPTPAEATYAARGTSVLVCDDDEDMVALLEHYLHRAGYALIATRRGDEAVQKAIQYEPDIVIMDVNVPGTNGIDAAQALRSQGFSGPVVALTASSLADDDTAVFTRCFRKPTPMQELLLEIKALVS